MYLASEDLAFLLSALNADPELAFIRGTGSGTWRAFNDAQELADGRHCLWHVPGGDLPLLAKTGSGKTTISDPWSGWREERSGADPSLPYFGPGHPSVVWLNVLTRPLRGPDGIGLSSFEWIGNHYSVIGFPASATTEKWWKRLRSFAKKNGERIPRAGPVDGPNPEIWAFPRALELIKAGAHRADNP
jgi:hypothetical protein